MTKRERRRNPAASFYNLFLQQEAARKLNFRAKKTMMLAQQLYEGIDLGKEGTVGLITYMRTDSTRISDVAKRKRPSILNKIWKRLCKTGTSKEKKQANAQDAHEAIRPTSTIRDTK